MKKRTFLLSLKSSDSDYQQEQASRAQEAARRCGVTLEILRAGNDAIVQSQQLLDAIQSSSPPDGILCHPVGTPLKLVARTAVSAGIAWVLLNREADYLAELRKNFASVPCFAVTMEQDDVGRIQGRQIGALLPEGGTVLYILGPASSPMVQQRLTGMQGAKPHAVQVRLLRGEWTERSGYEAMERWLGLPPSRAAGIALVAAQNDNMAFGSRQALLDMTSGEERERWSKAPFLGCDGIQQLGQEWVRRSILSGSIILPATAGLAVEMLEKAIEGKVQPAERTVVAPASFPPLLKLMEAGLRRMAIRA